MTLYLTSLKELLVQFEVVSCILLASEDLGCALSGNIILLISATQLEVNMLLRRLNNQ